MCHIIYVVIKYNTSKCTLQWSMKSDCLTVMKILTLSKIQTKYTIQNVPNTFSKFFFFLASKTYKTQYPTWNLLQNSN